MALVRKAEPAMISMIIADTLVAPSRLSRKAFQVSERLTSAIVSAPNTPKAAPSVAVA